MPFAWVGAATSIYGALNSSGGGGGGSSGGSPNAYIPMSQPAMDQNYQNNFNQYGATNDQLGVATTGAARDTFYNQYNNQYAPGYMAGANQAGQAYGQQASALGQQSNQSYGAANQIYQQAFDPQQSLYNQQLGQLTDSTRAAEYSRGVGMTPYGASVEANAVGNFQNQWQNQQLSREQTGISAMNSANEAGMNLGQSGANSYNLSGQVPYGAQNSIYGNQNTAIQNLNTNYQPYMQGLQQQQSNSLGYMNGAQGAQNQAFQQGQIGYQNSLNTANSLGQAGMQAYNAYNGGSNSFQNGWNTNVTNGGNNAYAGGAMDNTGQGLSSYNGYADGGGGV